MKKKTLHYSILRPTIGGVPQAVLCPADEAEKPLLLLVHGGPGEPMTPFVEELGELEKRFVVCLWEQRGAGLSYAAGKRGGEITLGRFVSDAIEVSRWLLARFQREKLVLMGFSWGTLVGILAAAQAPELFSVYIGIGQIADQAASEREAFAEALARATQAADSKAVALLQKLGSPPYSGKDAMKKMMKERPILRKYSDSPLKDGSMLVYFARVFRCPYYHLKDKVNFLRGLMSAGTALFNEVLETKVVTRVPALAIPAYVLQGKYDMQTRPRHAQELMEQLTAPKKDFFLFDYSGHSPMAGEPEAFLRTLDGIEDLYLPWRQADSPKAAN